MLGSVDVESISLAGAFLLGALFATVATLRIVKAVTNFFGGLDQWPRPRAQQPDNEETDG